VADWPAGAIMAGVWGWERITPWTLREIMLVPMFAVGCGFTAVVTAAVVTGGHWEVNPVAGTLGIYGFLGVWLTGVWRMMRTGLYASATAVRVRGPFRTRTIAWSEIVAVDARPARILGSPAVRPAIWFTLTDGRRIETPIQRRTGWSTWGMTTNLGPVLKGDQFDRVVKQLHQHSNGG
jgi:hypothetical protein